MTRLGGARVSILSGFFAACVGLSAVVPISDRTRLPFAVSDQRVVLHRRLSLCFPASLETNQREHPELALLRPVGLTARPGRPRAEEILLVFSRRPATRRCGFLFLRSGTLLGGDPQQPSTRRACGPRRVSRGWHYLSAFPCHRAWLSPRCFAAPSWPLRSVSSADVCCAVLTAACVALCCRNSFLLRTTRNS